MMYLDLIHLTATAGFCTLLWVVQLVVYPQMAKVRAEDFVAYHERHTRSITWIVAPLFFLEGLCAAAAFWLGWRGEPWVQGASIFLFAANSALTFLWFVPAHLELGAGKDAALLNRLIAANWCRTTLSSIRVVVVIGMLAG